jgi:hypothetical protein
MLCLRKPNNRLEFARVARPTRKEHCSLLAAQAGRSALQYMVSRHWASLRESAEFPTSVKKVLETPQTS